MRNFKHKSVKTKNSKIIFKVIGNASSSICRIYVETAVLSSSSENDLSELTCKYILIITCLFFLVHFYLGISYSQFQFYRCTRFTAGAGCRTEMQR